MNFLFSLMISIYLLFSASWAAEIQAEFRIVDADQVVREGDIVEGVLKLWPIENANLDEFRKLQENVLFNAFYLTDIQSLGVSENNADVVEMRSWFIVRGSESVNEQVLAYNGQNIVVPAPRLKIEKLTTADDDYYIMEQSVNYSTATKIIFVVGALGLLSLAIIKRKKIGEVIKKIRRDPVTVAKKSFNELFSSANSREDYERIHARRKEWLGLIQEKVPAYNDFFKIMEQHQYKKKWTSEELSEVKNCFDVIRGSFK